VTLGPILTVNGGSSSLHLAYVTEGSAGEGNVGEGSVGEGSVGAGSVGDRMDLAEPPTSAQAMDAVAEFVRDREPPAAVAHRLVHGGERLRHPSLVDDTIRADLDAVADLAPLHVPPSLRLLDQLRTLMPNVPHVVCPDNAFHADLPEVAATFPLPASWRSRWGLRRYGFHGLSYAWSTRRTAELLRRPVGELRLVLAHLGGGASVCAVRGGRSVDTSMGFTPLDGVPMSKRSGAVDPGMLLWLLDGRLDVDQLSAGLYHESGLLGLSGGRSGDTRVLVAAAAKGDATAQLAMDVYIHRVRREFAAAATSLDRLDAVVFTGEIGWDQPEVRHGVCAGLSLLGVDIPALSERPDDGPVSAAGAAVPVIVVEPREELQLAIEARALLG
jgi:acetate kinase